MEFFIGLGIVALIIGLLGLGATAPTRTSQGWPRPGRGPSQPGNEP